MTKQTLKSFVARINEHGLPILARTARSLSAVVTDEKSSIGDMANLILQDSSLTAKVIRLANSAYYNRGLNKISTVNRAIIQLGVQTMHSICVTAALVENLLEGKPRERVIREMIQAFQTAIHAKSFALARRESNVEEVFVAALLLRIGHLAFWCLGGELADDLEKAMEQDQVKPSQIEREVLGFSLDRLTLELVQQWQLGDILEKACRRQSPSDSRVYNLFLSHELTRVTQDATHGWRDPDLQTHLDNVGKFIQRSQEELRDLVRENIGEAVELVTKHGLGQYVRFIRLPDDAPPQPVPQAEEEQQDIIPDALLQMEILQELSDLIKNGKPDVNLLLSTLMEGISRGITMDRVVLLIYTPDRKRLVARYAIGMGRHDILGLSFPARSPSKNIFDHVLEEKKPIWVDAGRTPKLLGYLTPTIKNVLRPTSFFLTSLNVKDQPIGFVYADRQPSGRNPDEESFVSFQFFSRLANAGLSSLASSGSR